MLRKLLKVSWLTTIISQPSVRLGLNWTLMDWFLRSHFPTMLLCSLDEPQPVSWPENKGFSLGSFSTLSPMVLYSLLVSPSQRTKDSLWDAHQNSTDRRNGKFFSVQPDGRNGVSSLGESLSQITKDSL